MRVPFDSDRFDWGTAAHERVEHLGRTCVRLEPTGDATPVVTVADLELEDGSFEVELAVDAERSFPGVAWRVQDADNHESFFVRPHQVGNPDAIQYTPVRNGLSAWQLYHGEGYWNAVTFPVDAWFRLRVAFAGPNAEVRIDDELVLACALKRPVEAGRLGILVGAGRLHLAGLGYDTTPPSVPARPAAEPLPGVVPTWSVSDPFPETELAEPELDAARLAARSWSSFDVEPTGLLDLARAHPLRDGRDTVFARAIVHSNRTQVKRLDLGFSDRALVYLGGRALYRGADGYRSRDYRFLGSIGWYDTLYLPLAEGANELIVAVSEDFGGWGIQARFPDPSGLGL